MISRENGTAVPAPLLVMIVPSMTTGCLTNMPPSNLSSNPGKHVAFFPFKIPALPSTDGAAQIAAQSFPFMNIF
jgi:hypothetical protein